MRMQQLVQSASRPDSPFEIVPAFVWSYIEIVSGIVCASLPLCKPVFCWGTNRLGLTGENGMVARLKLFKVDLKLSGPFAGDLEEGRVGGHGPAGFTARAEMDSASDSSGAFAKYLKSGDTTLFNTMVSQAKSESSDGSSEVEAGKAEVVEVRLPRMPRTYPL